MKKWTTLFLALALMLTSVSAFAQTRVLVIDATGKAPGTRYYLEVVVTENGVTARPVNVYVLGDPTVTPVDPDDPDPVDPLSDVSKKTKEFTKQALDNGGTVETAKVLRALYLEVLRLHTKEEGDGEDVKVVWKDSDSMNKSIKTLQLAIPFLLGELDDGDKWTQWSSNINKLITELRQQSLFNAQTLKDIARGMDPNFAITKVNKNLILQALEGKK